MEAWYSTQKTTDLLQKLRCGLVNSLTGLLPSKFGRDNLYLWGPELLYQSLLSLNSLWKPIGLKKQLQIACKTKYNHQELVVNRQWTDMGQRAIKRLHDNQRLSLVTWPNWCLHCLSFILLLEQKNCNKLTCILAKCQNWVGFGSEQAKLNKFETHRIL